MLGNKCTRVLTFENFCLHLIHLPISGQGEVAGGGVTGEAGRGSGGRGGERGVRGQEGSERRELFLGINYSEKKINYSHFLHR